MGIKRLQRRGLNIDLGDFSPQRLFLLLGGKMFYLVQTVGTDITVMFPEHALCFAVRV